MNNCFQLNLVRLSSLTDDYSYKTKVKPKTLNPKWNEEGEINIQSISQNFRVYFQGRTNKKFKRRALLIFIQYLIMIWLAHTILSVAAVLVKRN